MRTVNRQAIDLASVLEIFNIRHSICTAKTQPVSIVASLVFVFRGEPYCFSGEGSFDCDRMGPGSQNPHVRSLT